MRIYSSEIADKLVPASIQEDHTSVLSCLEDMQMLTDVGVRKPFNNDNSSTLDRFFISNWNFVIKCV